MIDQMTGLYCDVFYYVFLASWRALPVFAVVAIATLVLRKRVPARYLCWLWLIVVARLLLPVSATSMMAISAIADAPTQMLFFRRTIKSQSNKVGSTSSQLRTKKRMQ